MRRGRIWLVLALLATLSPLLSRDTTRVQASAERPPFRYGMIVDGSSSTFSDVSALGFGWIKLYVSWNSIESAKGSFGNWPDSAVTAARANNLNVVLLVYDTPGWAIDGAYNPNNPPPTSDHLGDFGTFMGTLAAHYKGQVGAYEVWNEENLNDEWGYENPDPAYFAQMLQAAYPKLKAADPNALVISGGLSNTGNGSPPSVLGDLTYLQTFLQAGGGSYVDAIGIHPYPGACDPTATSCGATPGTYFQRANDEHNVAVSLGYGSLPFWITEAGYFSKPSNLDPAFADCDNNSGLGGFPAYEVDETTKANWLVAAYQYVDQNWSWVGMFMMMNLDFMMDTTRAHCDPVRFWGILDHNGNPSPAYNALKSMVKSAPAVTFGSTYNRAVGTVTIGGTVSDPNLPGAPGIQEVIATVDSPYNGTNPTLPTTFGSNGGFTVTVNTSGLSYGVTHLVYVYVLTATQGWAFASIGVIPAPQVNDAPGRLTLSIDPSKSKLATATITMERNDGSSSPYYWSATSNQSWLTVTSDENHATPWTALAVTANATGLPNGTYLATITINGQTEGWLLNLPTTIPVTVVVGPTDAHHLYLPISSDGAVPGGL